MEVNLRDITDSDKVLVLAWRSNPLIYQGFYEQGYLGKGSFAWETHTRWWNSLDNTWKRWIIQFAGRDIGCIWVLKLDKDTPEIGVFIGETTLQGRGIGRNSLDLVLDWLRNRRYPQVCAKMLKNNDKSIRLFESLAFRYSGDAREGEWIYEKGLVK